MNAVETSRLSEILFYYFFTKKEEELLGQSSFWKTIENICNAYGIDSMSVSRAVRILMAPENVPAEDETFYLFDKLKMPVRAINKVSGIYWQKQIALKADFEAGKLPIIRNRITDIVMKRAIRSFIHAIYEFFGILGYIDIRTLGAL